jgi:hypothetical protein
MHNKGRLSYMAFLKFPHVMDIDLHYIILCGDQDIFLVTKNRLSG